MNHDDNDKVLERIREVLSYIIKHNLPHRTETALAINSLFHYLDTERGLNGYWLKVYEAAYLESRHTALLESLQVEGKE